MPPKQVLAEVKRIVGTDSGGVQQEKEGVIYTGWSRHRGDFHIGRHWQERTRFRVAVIPDWNEPTNRARIEVTAQTEERAAEGQKWSPNPALHRADRAQALLDRIVSELKRTDAAR